MTAIGPRPPPPPTTDPATAPGTGPAPAPAPAAGASGPAPASEAGRLALPSWYPADFDLDRAAAGARAIIEAQGEPPGSIGPGKAKRLVFVDADLTLINSSPPSRLVHKTTGEVLKHPETGAELALGLGPERDAKKELAALKARYPAVRWADYRLDDSAYGSREEILKTPAIGSTVSTLKASDRSPASRDFIITARRHATVPPALDEYLGKRKVDINGVFAVSHQPTAGRLGMVKFPSQQRKAIAMAALLKLYQPAEGRLDRVRFLDDTDKNLVAGMQLLPKLFPKTRFEFYDVVHKGGDRFERVLVAKSDLRRPGELVDARGRVVTPEQIAAYKSADAPFPDRGGQR